MWHSYSYVEVLTPIITKLLVMYTYTSSSNPEQDILEILNYTNDY